MTAALKAFPDRNGTERVFVRRVGPVAPLRELSVVQLVVDAQTIGERELVAAGTEGTIVAVHGGGRAYDVEVSDPAGVVAVVAADIRAK